MDDKIILIDRFPASIIPPHPSATRAAAKKSVCQTWYRRRHDQSYSVQQGSRYYQNHASRIPNQIALLSGLPVRGMNLDASLPSSRKYDRTVAKRKSPLTRTATSFQANTYFPSVIAILQAKELVQHVYSLKSGVGSEAVRVLPTYNDWDTALAQTARSRNRAFLLVDLAAIIHTLIAWKRKFRKVTVLYSVQANTDPELVRIVLKSGITGLSTANQWDIKQTLDYQPVYDDTRMTNKPNSYLREWFRRHSPGRCTIVVSGPEEVERVQQFLTRLRLRRSADSFNVILDFQLRLPAAHETWMTVLVRTLRKLEGTNSRVVGFTINISDSCEQRALEEFLDDISRKNNESNVAASLRIDFQGTESRMFPDYFEDWWSLLANRPDVSQITVDATKELVSRTGMLATRIIGVRELSNRNGQGTCSQRHYYIDDGCYGSLNPSQCRSGLDSSPFPLIMQKTTPSRDQAIADVMLSTIWGPTCDGLDLVCRDIQLPRLSRDDWLVFPNVGCACSDGSGTGFNGFQPPDTVYCVLGFFKSRFP